MFLSLHVLSSSNSRQHSACGLLAGNSSAGCPVTIYKLLIARDMLGTVHLIKKPSCRACDVKMLHFITVSRRGGLCHAVGDLRWDLCVTVPVTRRFYSLHSNKVSFVEPPPWTKESLSCSYASSIVEGYEKRLCNFKCACALWSRFESAGFATKSFHCKMKSIRCIMSGWRWNCLFVRETV